MGTEDLKLQMELDQVMETIRALERDIAAEEKRVKETASKLQEVREKFFQPGGEIAEPLSSRTMNTEKVVEKEIPHQVSAERQTRTDGTTRRIEQEKNQTGNRYCPKCGNYVGEFRFCGKCGFEVNPEK